MEFQPDPTAIVWRLHLDASPDVVFDTLDSDEGRAGFWAESAVESGGVIHFEFANGMRYAGRIIDRVRPELLSVDYFGSVAEFTLEGDGAGGTDVTLRNTGVGDEHRVEVIAGWLNVLFPLKAFVDHGVDLRNHDEARTWDQGFLDG